MEEKLNDFEENALIYLLRHTNGVKFIDSVKPGYYWIIIRKKACKEISKDELFKIFLRMYVPNGYEVK